MVHKSLNRSVDISAGCDFSQKEDGSTVGQWIVSHSAMLRVRSDEVDLDHLIPNRSLHHDSPTCEVGSTFNQHTQLS